MQTKQDGRLGHRKKFGKLMLETSPSLCPQQQIVNVLYNIVDRIYNRPDS